MKSPIQQSNSIRTSGFTLAEMVLVVAVMAVLVSVSAPPLFQFIKQRDIREEQNMQLDIQKAMTTYLTNTGQLPTDVISASVTDPNNWFNALAGYTNLSSNQIRFDVWGNERRYILLQQDQTMLGSSIPVYYATLLSAGPDAKAQSATGIPINTGGTFTYNSAAGGNIGGFASESSTSWWKSRSNPVSSYSSLQVASGSDDMLIRFTDYPDKIKRYNTTLDRLDRVATALETYSKAKYAEAVVAGTDTLAEKRIYYPRAVISGMTGDSSNYYSDVVKADVSTANNGGNNYISVSTNNNTRYTNMVTLMRVLGLPDDTCCSALTTFTDSSGVLRDVPFFYASNPRPRNADGSCATRPTPTAATNNITLPARISVQAPTVAGTCY